MTPLQRDLHERGLTHAPWGSMHGAGAQVGPRRRAAATTRWRVADPHARRDLGAPALDRLVAVMQRPRGSAFALQRPVDVADRSSVEGGPVTDSAALGLGGDVPLWLAGTMPPRPRLAIVGSRAAVATLRAAVPPIVAAARELGWSICSGGALGIDGDAHRAALA